jgi:hypothetical protein
MEYTTKDISKILDDVSEPELVSANQTYYNYPNPTLDTGVLEDCEDGYQICS